MKRATFSKCLLYLLAAAVVLVLGMETAAADPGTWVLPWTALDHSYMSRILVDHSDATATIDQSDIGVDGVKYTGYWHSLYFHPESMLCNSIGLIAPAGGTVLYSTKWNLEVMTDDGDLYELAIFDSESAMFEFPVGNTINMGDAVGELSLMTKSPTLSLEYLVKQEPIELFGLARRWFGDGANLKDLDFTLFSGAELPDLIVGAITVNGYAARYESGPNGDIAIMEPKSDILFDTGIINMSPTATETGFNIKWFINGEQIGYGAHEFVPGYTDLTEGNSYLWWSFEPGMYLVQFWVDCDNHIEESDEMNNVSEVTVVVGY